MSTGLFIVLEGVDGAGTTTHSKRLGAALNALGAPTHVTQEPSNGPIGTLLRQVLTGRLVIAGTGAALSSQTMALLFAADRMDHLEAEIAPLLQAGTTIVCDRYYHSSLAYQSLTGDRSAAYAAWLREINRQARRPDLTIVLDLPAEVAALRRRTRANREIYEDDALQRELCAYYANIESHFPGERIVHLSSDRAADLVAADLVEAVQGLWREVGRPETVA